MISIKLSTPKGELFTSDEVKFIVVHTPKGEFGILKDHIPILSTVSSGFVKIETESTVTFASLVSGVIEFKDNTCSIISNIAATGNTLDEANKNLDELQQNLKRKNKEDNKTFVINELELKKAIKKARAGQ